MKTILLIEDDPFIADIYGKQLKKEGFKVDIVKDGQMALEKIKDNYYDLLLLDILLPKVGGWEILKIIRNDPRTKNIKVFIISNQNQKDYAKEILNLGVIKYFLKVETTPEEIANSIKESLK